MAALDVGDARTLRPQWYVLCTGAPSDAQAMGNFLTHVFLSFLSFLPSLLPSFLVTISPKTFLSVDSTQ